MHDAVELLPIDPVVGRLTLAPHEEVEELLVGCDRLADAASPAQEHPDRAEPDRVHHVHDQLRRESGQVVEVRHAVVGERAEGRDVEIGLVERDREQDDERDAISGAARIGVAKPTGIEKRDGPHGSSVGGGRLA